MSVLGSLLFVFLLSACDSNYFFEENHSFTNTNWSQTDTAVFSVEITDTLQAFNFLLNLRHTNDYPFRNLYLFVKTIYPNGKSNIDTLQLLLGAPDGEWFGKGRGSIFTDRVLLKNNINFPDTGTYIFEFIQAMRTENLEGVEDFGIRIEKSEK